MTVDQLEEFFEKTDVPNKIQLGPHGMVLDSQTFIQSHLSYLKGNPSNKAYLPYYNRLINLAEILGHKN